MEELVASWADGPLLALDLETTDCNPLRDRIVTATVVFLPPASRQGAKREPQTWEWLADPGVEIPPDATALHSITTEFARRNGRPAAEVVTEVAEVLGELWTSSTPLCAYNATFDLTMLDAEMRRHIGRGLVLSGPVIDPMRLDWVVDQDVRNRRTLSAACSRHEVRLDNAHTGARDTLATLRLAWKLAGKFPNEIGKVQPYELRGSQAAAFGDFKRKLGRRTPQQAQLMVESWPLLPSSAESRPAEEFVQPRQPDELRSSHASWTAEEEERLRRAWLAADPGYAANNLRKEIAEKHGRSPVAIRTRLLRIRCHPEQPGQMVSEAEAGKLQQAYQAEFNR